MWVFPLKILGSEVNSKMMVEPPRSFGRGNSDHEKQETDTGVLCAFQHFKYSDSLDAVLQNSSNSVDILDKRNHSQQYDKNSF